MLAWKIFNGAINTDDMLQRRNTRLASRCAMCVNESETREHILFSCEYAMVIRKHICSWFRLQVLPKSLEDMMKVRHKFSPLISELWTVCSIMVIVMLWKRRNKWIYERRSITVIQIERTCLNAIAVAAAKSSKNINNSVTELLIMHSLNSQVAY